MVPAPETMADGTRRLWTRRDVRRAAVVIVFLAVQLGLPALQLAHDGVARFGWQMFFRLGASQAFEQVHADGTASLVDLQALAVNPRPEIVWLPTVHERVCAQQTAVAVRYRDAAAVVREVRCD